MVTDKAKSKWVRFVRQKLKTLQSGEKIYISGCGSMKDGEIDRDFYGIYPELVEYRELLVLLPEEPEDSHSSGDIRSNATKPSSPALLPKGEGGNIPSPFGRGLG